MKSSKNSRAAEARRQPRGNSGRKAVSGEVSSDVHRIEEFRLLVEAVREYAIFMINPEGYICTWNAGAERIKGYAAGEIIGRHFSCFYPEEDVRMRKPQKQLAMAAEQGVAEDEGWRVRKDGSRFWANIVLTSIRDESGRLIGFAKVTQDVTERMENAQSLRESEARYRTVVESATEAIVSASDDTRIRFVNPATTQMFQYSYAELIGKELSLLIPTCPKTFGDHEVLEWQAIERIGRRKNGEEFPVEVSLASVKGGSGVYVCFFRDITARKRTEKKLTESERSLRKLSLHLLRAEDEERRRIGRELHDSLGQGLVALKMNLDSLASSTAKQETITQIDECRRLAENMIKELRTISYLMHPPMLDELGLKAAVSWYLEGFSQRSQIATTLDIPSDFQRLPSDVELTLFRVLQESLTNVHRHSGSPTAHIRLFTHGASASEITVYMEVIDQGRGMPETISGTLDLDVITMGVGLRGMDERLRQLGGTLKIISTSGGTTLIATVPLAATEASCLASFRPDQPR